jgi:hypothetical protein
MNIFPKSRRGHGLAVRILPLLVLASIAGCNKKSEDDPVATEPEGTTTSPSVPAAASDPISARLFVASNTTRTIAMYKLDGTYVGFIDLTSTGTGNVTAMAWVDKTNLLAFFDTGTSGERILKITFTSDSSYTINANWYSDTTNLSNTTVLNMHSAGFSTSPVILVSKSAANLEAIYTNTGYTFAARSGNPYITTGGSCPATTISYVTRNVTGDRVILASTGANARINVFAANNACTNAAQSYNYTSSYPANAAYTPVGMAATATQLFVRYQHASTPVIAACALDTSVAGTATAPITGCAALVSDAGMLGVNAANKEMVYEASGNSLYYPNWDSGAIMQTNASSGYTIPLIRDVFSQNVNSISIRPAN